MIALSQISFLLFNEETQDAIGFVIVAMLSSTAILRGMYGKKT